MHLGHTIGILRQRRGKPGVGPCQLFGRLQLTDDLVGAKFDETCQLI